MQRLRLRSVHSLSYLSTTNALQYARVPTGEIKLPDMRLHHHCAQVGEIEGQRAFKHACLTGLLRLVKKLMATYNRRDSRDDEMEDKLTADGKFGIERKTRCLRPA